MSQNDLTSPGPIAPQAEAVEVRPMEPVNEAETLREAAGIWARAKACRDGDPAPASVEATLPGIQRRMALGGAQLLLATSLGRGVGFALFAPRGKDLEIFYLAVDPDVWGNGVGSKLLDCAQDHARALGNTGMELWVIDDNHRALEVYERNGFLRTGDIERDPSSGRIEHRLAKQLD